jgi:hypothetical protein
MDYTGGPNPPDSPPPPPSSPPPPPSYPGPIAPPPKKGLPPLAWVGIGCGGLVVVIGVIAVITAMAVGKKVIAGFKDHPGKDAVHELVERMPDYQKIDEDAEKGTITLHSRASGETVTTDYDPLVLGRTEVKDAAGAPRPIASGDLAKVPSWVPRHPAAETETCVVQRDDATVTSGVIAFTTKDPLDDTMDFYRKQADSLAMHSSASSSADFNGRASRSLRFSGGKRSLRIHAHAINGPPWIVQVIYEEKK